MKKNEESSSMYQHSEETYPGSSAVTSTPRCNMPCHPQESMLHADKGFMKKWMHSSQSVTKRHKVSQSVTKPFWTHFRSYSIRYLLVLLHYPALNWNVKGNGVLATRKPEKRCETQYASNPWDTMKTIWPFIMPIAAIGSDPADRASMGSFALGTDFTRTPTSFFTKYAFLHLKAFSVRKCEAARSILQRPSMLCVFTSLTSTFGSFLKRIIKLDRIMEVNTTTTKMGSNTLSRIFGSSKIPIKPKTHERPPTLSALWLSRTTCCHQTAAKSKSWWNCETSCWFVLTFFMLYVQSSTKFVPTSLNFGTINHR